MEHLCSGGKTQHNDAEEDITLDLTSNIACFSDCQIIL